MQFIYTYETEVNWKENSQLKSHWEVFRSGKPRMHRDVQGMWTLRLRFGLEEPQSPMPKRDHVTSVVLCPGIRSTDLPKTSTGRMGPPRVIGMVEPLVDTSCRIGSARLMDSIGEFENLSEYEQNPGFVTYCPVVRD